MEHIHQAGSTFKLRWILSPDTTDDYQLPLKKFEEHDIDIAIDACGVCGSDVHKITGGWGDYPKPLIVGHEIIGKAIRVGDQVKNIKVGDRVGVGAQICADLTCVNCKADQENYCPNALDTYGDTYPDGTVTQGGYSSHIRAHEYFTFKIPDNIPDELAAPMLCAGITVYSPLVRLGCGPGKKIAVVGLYVLLHMSIRAVLTTIGEDWAILRFYSQ
jgi:alcohol dehydrogenase (NADP+)